MFVHDRAYNLDCVEGLKQLTNVDLVIADPPYVISRDSNFHTMKDRAKPRTGTMLAAWDLEFDNAPWIAQAGQCLKPGGALVVFNAWTKATSVDSLCRDAGLVYKDTLTWKKLNPMPRNIQRRYVPDVEMMQWHVKPGKWTFNLQQKPYASCVLPFASESGGGHVRYHPTQKPVKLLETLIRTHSNEGDLVVDPFLGSGATAVAARNCGRRFIGFEIDPLYYQTCCQRLGQDE